MEDSKQYVLKRKSTRRYRYLIVGGMVTDNLADAERMTKKEAFRRKRALSSGCVSSWGVYRVGPKRVKTLADYEKKSQALADYPGIGMCPLYPAMGLAGEAGEVLEKVKKIWRDKDVYDIQPEDRKKILIEAGDALWYVAAVARELHSSLEEVAEMNLEKLNGRKARGTLSGEGDDR